MRLRVRVHPAGAALLAACLLLAPSHAVLAAVAALCWHELAHIAAMALCGVESCEVELTPFGGMACAGGYDRLAPGRKAVCALSGVAASALGAWLCLRFAPNAPFWFSLYMANASLAAFNLLPVWPLDGARALLAAAERLGAEGAVRHALRLLAYALGCAMAALGLYGAWLGQVNLSLLCAGPYLAYAAHACGVAQAVRRMQRAQEAARKLDGDRVARVRTYACAGEPTQAALARLAGRGEDARYQMLVMVDPETGRACGSLTESEIARRLFKDAEGER